MERISVEAAMAVCQCWAMLSCRLPSFNMHAIFHAKATHANTRIHTCILHHIRTLFRPLCSLKLTPIRYKLHIWYPVQKSFPAIHTVNFE